VFIFQAAPSKDGGKKEFVPADPPKDNPWTRKKERKLTI